MEISPESWKIQKKNVSIQKLMVPEMAWKWKISIGKLENPIKKSFYIYSGMEMTWDIETLECWLSGVFSFTTNVLSDWFELGSFSHSGADLSPGRQLEYKNIYIYFLERKWIENLALVIHYHVSWLQLSSFGISGHFSEQIDSKADPFLTISTLFFQWTFYSFPSKKKIKIICVISHLDCARMDSQLV